MQGTLFNQENAALQPMYFWFGQIVDDSTWKDNELSEKWNDPDEIPGWGSRFRVRIFGRDIGDVDNSRLDMAECIYPVTYYDCDDNCLNDSDSDSICDFEDICPGFNDFDDSYDRSYFRRSAFAYSK